MKMKKILALIGLLIFVNYFSNCSKKAFADSVTCVARCTASYGNCNRDCEKFKTKIGRSVCFSMCSGERDTCLRKCENKAD